MQLRLFLLQPTVVFRAQINQTTFEYPLAEVAWDNLTLGTIANVQPGMTVVFGSSLGRDDLGRQRIRKPATTDTLYFGRSSRGNHDGELDLVDNCWVEVWGDYRVFAKIPQMPVVGETVVTYKDHDLEVGTNTTTPPPVANAGPGYAATIDPVSSLITVDFDASNSIAIADGASISGYAWDVADGTITVGTAASAAITATFPAGFRWVSLTVTDSNGKSHTARTPVYARDPNADTSIQAFEITQHRITPAGQQLSLRILEDIPASQVPDGTLALLWDDDAVTAGRGHMQFIGWHHTDPAQIAGARTGTLRDVTLECLDVAGKLATLPGFPQALYADAIRDTATTPAITWEYMVNPTIRKYLHYLLHWHSTALDLADFRFRGVSSDYPFLVLESGGASLFDQVDSRAQQITPDHRLTCTRRGELAIWPDPMLLDPVDRTEVYQGEITQAMWSEMHYSHQRPPRVYWLRAGAIVAQDTPVYRADGSLDIPTVFCVAPGTAPGQGETAQEENERLVLSQDALNRVTGHRYARLNAPDSRYTIQLVGSDDLGLEPADLEWVRVYLSPSVAAQRGQYFETMAGILLFFFERGLVHSIDIRYQQGRAGLLRTVTLEWEREVAGTPAVTVIPPQAEPADDYDPWPIPEAEATPFSPNLFAGQTTIAVVTDAFGLWRTSTFDQAAPTWSTAGLSYEGGSNYLFDFVVNPFSSLYRGVGNEVNGWYATQGRIYRVDDLFGVSVNGTTQSVALTFPVTASYLATGKHWRMINASFGRYFAEESDNPWLIAVSYYHTTSGHTGTWATFSKNAGGTWSNEVQITPHYQLLTSFDLAPYEPGLYLSPKSWGRAYTSAWLYSTGSNVLNTSGGFTTGDWGETWNELASPSLHAGGNRLAMDIHIPWPDNPDEEVAYYGYSQRTGGTTWTHKLMRATSTTTEDISPVVGGITYGPAAGRDFCVRTFDGDRRYVALAGRGRNAGGTTYYGAFVSSDYGNTWTTIVSPTTGPYYPTGIAFGGDNQNILYLWGKGYLAYSDNFGATIQDKWGNLSAGLRSQTVVALMGG